MRIAIASFGQETSSFSPALTTLDTFRQYGLYEGQEVLRHCRGVPAVGGFLEVVDETIDWEPVPIIHGWAGAHGPLTPDTLAFFHDKTVSGLQSAGKIDVLYFALHGAGEAQNEPDTEGHLIEAARAVVGPDVPIVISLDHHANLTERMMRNCDALVAHRTQPHDQPDTGRLAGEMLVDIVRGNVVPTMAYRKIPLITHQEQFLTSRGPMKEWFDLACNIETRDGVVSASNFPMQPWLDVPEGGWATAVVTNGDQVSQNDAPKNSRERRGICAKLSWCRNPFHRQKQSDARKPPRRDSSSSPTRGTASSAVQQATARASWPKCSNRTSSPSPSFR